MSACGKKNNTERSPSSLEMLVNELDIHSDRIFHIGTFAMACSEDCQSKFSYICDFVRYL